MQGLKFKLTLSPKYGEVEGVGRTLFYMANVVYESDAINLIHNALEMQEKRLKYSIDIKRLELEAKQLGNALTFDDPADVQEEFYVNNDKDIDTIEEEIKEKANSKEIVIDIKEEKEPVDKPVDKEPIKAKTPHKPLITEEKPVSKTVENSNSKPLLKLKMLKKEFEKASNIDFFKSVCKEYLAALGANKLSDLDDMTLQDLIRNLNEETEDMV